MYKNFDTNLIAHYWLMHDIFDPKFYYDSNTDLHEFNESDHESLKSFYY